MDSSDIRKSPSSQTHLLPGDWVEVRSFAEICAGLGEEGRLDGLPFMPEMLACCGERFPVLHRIENTCVAGNRMRKFQNHDVVFLREVRCYGAAHGGCQRRCLLFWKEAWLKRVDGDSSQPSTAPTRESNPVPLRTGGDLVGYSCQRTELVRATVALSRSERALAWLRPVPTEPATSESVWPFSIGTHRSPEVQVEALATEDLPLWDAFVAAHPDGCLYHLSKWKRILEESFPHIRGQFLAIKKGRSGEIVAGLPVYTVRSWLLGNRLVSVPFASYCDPLLTAGHGLNDFLPKVSELLRQSGANRLQLRPSGSAKVSPLPDLERSSLYFHHFIALDGELEALKKRFSRTCVRQWLSRAERSRVTIERGHTYHDLQRVYAIVTETRRRHFLPPIPFRFFESLQRVLQPDHLEILTAWLEGEPIAGALALKYRDTFTLEYAGEAEAARNTGASQLLYWEAIQLAHSEHFRRFSLGRTSVFNTGLAQYKRRWGTIEEELPILTLAIDGSHRSRAQEKLLLYRLAQAVVRHCPEPGYRTLGEFCYRHWG